MTDFTKRNVIFLVLIATLVLTAPVAAATTSLTITKLASDGTTVLDSRTVDYTWMMNNLDILGDGTTHYYHQGPVFLDNTDPVVEQQLRWNPEEDTNIDKDMGAVKGTNVKDLCDLVGGMNAGETIQVKAADGFTKYFAYDNVYGYSIREGPMGIVWSQNGLYPDTGYTDGMRLVWFADDSVNPNGDHVFGNYDWYLAADEAYWYYYVSGTEKYPTTTGLSVTDVSDITIYSDDPAPTVDVLYNGPVTLTPGETFTKTAYNTPGSSYTISETTPLGALQATGLTYDVTDKNFATSGALLLDNVGTYLRDKTNGIYWYAYVNDAYKDGYNNPAGGLNLIELNDGDRVEFYYAAGITDPADLATVKAAATATVKTVVDIPPPYDLLFDGTVTLTPSETFIKTAYNTPGSSYTISETTPLGALQATGLTYDVTDKNFATSGALLLDNVGTYLRDKTNGIYWYAYVNDAYKDGYNNPAGGLNLIELNDGDRVEFYYAAGITDPADLGTVRAAATATVKTVVDIPPPYDLLFDGTVTLTPGETFIKTAYNTPGSSYTISETTPLGALQATGLTYDVTDKNFATSGALLLDNVDAYLRKTPGYWYAYVNDAYKDGYNNPAGGLNLIELNDGDRVEFYYAAGITDPADLATVKAATIAAVKTVASTGVTPTDWSIVLDGAKTMTVNKAYFEQGLAHAHQEYWTDADGNVWGGMPLWLLAGLVDDDPDDGAYHDNFNDDLAAQHYEVKVISSDGWSAVFDSAEIARSTDYLVANTFNDEPLPTLTEGGKISWPLHLVGAGITKEDGSLGGRSIGSIARIELNNLPEPEEGWTLAMLGEVGDTITQQEFEDGLACTQSGHLVEYIDNAGNTWSGVPLWVLLGTIDDIELSDHWTFNDDVAAAGYTVKITALDGFSKTYSGATVARNDNYIVANKINGEPLTDAYPLRLVGSGVTKDGALSGSAIGQIALIEIPDLQTPAPATGSYNLALNGKITDVLSQQEIEEGLACPRSGHLVTWTQKIKDAGGNVIETHEWSGIPLWFLAGWVDDRQPHDFDTVQATAGYKITVVASDGYAKDFQSADVAWSSDYIIATMKDGAPLPADKWPLQLVGDPLTRADGTLSGTSVSKVAEIKLTEFGVPVEIPKLHIVKYGEDGQTVDSEVTIDYTQMQQQFEVIGDGVTQYRYQGVTNDPTDIWGVNDETKGGFKISNAVKGTRVYDLVQLVGGMGEGTDIVFVANDGYKTVLPYTSIYTTEEIQERQGDAILAWYADGKYVPGYADGMRLFFTPEDTIYGQWDMHESMPAGHWHYYYTSYPAGSPYYPGILYPSAAGTSAKYITEIRVYSAPEADWDLQLDGTRVGGIEYTVNKGYFEAALACQMGANHESSYTDSSGNVWTGMPLWFLQGFVDDADQHSNNAYNQALAEQGYDIVVMASDGYSKTFNSADTVRSTGYIIANTVNGYHIPESDASWPLRLVGDNVPKKDNVKAVSEIILNFRPVIDSLTIPTDPVMVGTEASAVAYFTDPYDTPVITVIDWGDGQTSDGVVDEEAGLVTGSHVYAENGFYTVSVTIVDSAGVTVEKTADAAIVVYDPACGEASGSGTIQVGLDDTPWSPEAVGKASFSLTAQYNKGVPSGNAKLGIGKSQFTAAFFDYIVIKDQTAYIHGMGSIDKSGNDFEFLLVAKDDGNKSDTYRLQIWDIGMNKVFDNAPEAERKLDADTTPVTGGSVVIN